jgi:hypothetical protein
LQGHWFEAQPRSIALANTQRATHACLGCGNINAVADGLRFGETDYSHARLSRLIEEAKDRALVACQRVCLPALRAADA